MLIFTSHLREDQPLVLVREGFSWRAAVWGALYLAMNRAWIAAALIMAAFVLTLGLTQAAHTGAPLLGLAVLQGLLCPDLLRWNLASRGYRPGPVVSGVDRDQALGRLLDARPDLLPAGVARA